MAKDAHGEESDMRNNRQESDMPVGNNQMAAGQPTRRVDDITQADVEHVVKLATGETLAQIEKGRYKWDVNKAALLVHWGDPQRFTWDPWSREHAQEIEMTEMAGADDCANAARNLINALPSGTTWTDADIVGLLGSI